MAIETNTFNCNSVLYTDTDSTISSRAMTFLESILSFYEWNPKSSVVNASKTYVAKYYFTENSYIEVQFQPQNPSRLTCKLITPSKTVTFAQSNPYITMSATKTSKGIALSLYAVTQNVITDVFAFNCFIGDCTLNGQTVKGCIVADNNNNLTIATDNGIATETAFGTTINPDRKAVLAPVVNTATGEVFSDIYEMRYSPFECNIMDVDGQGIFLCGKTVCLKDQGV